jgi:Fuc2NAc and GlcNAc transferase
VTGFELLLSGSFALLMSFLGTGLVRRVATAHDFLDVPNERSSHRSPTPRGGGLSIVVVTTGALVLLAWAGTIGSSLFVTLLGGGVLVALVGLLDDRRSVSPTVRLLVHLGAAGWALYWLGGLGPLQVGERIVTPAWSGYAFGALGIVWALNLFNFMDGIDGIAASEATFVSWAGALLISAVPGSDAEVAVAAVFGATALGFLGWNWPPARIFMGDVGSGYIGYVIAVLVLASTRDNPAALWVWLTLNGTFLVDSTVTLLRRLARGEAVFKAHRSHAYQWLARRWGGHRAVTLAVGAVNMLWLLPWAVAEGRWPRYALACMTAALAPLVLLAFALRAGAPESGVSEQ